MNVSMTTLIILKYSETRKHLLRSRNRTFRLNSHPAPRRSLKIKSLNYLDFESDGVLEVDFRLAATFFDVEAFSTTGAQ